MFDRIAVVDLETSGLSVEEGHTVCECARTDLTRGTDGKWMVGHTFSTLVNPGRDIPPEACAVHHITNLQTDGAPSWIEAQHSTLTNGNPDVYASHNAKFDRQWFDPHGAKWICSYKCALTLAPNAPGWGNQVLRYWLKLQVDDDASQPPHRAGPDTHVTAHLLRRMLAKATVEQLVEISAKPVVLPVLTFGKHAMEPCDKVPDGYWRWMLDKGGFDDDVMHTAFHYLNLRRNQD